MVLTHQELHPQIVLPSAEDQATAARNSSFLCWLAGMWFFLSPWAFFGVSEQRSGWNAWIVGGFMAAISMARLAKPRETTWMALANSVLAVWTILSPWIFGYTEQTSRATNTVGVGLCVLGFSIMSGVFSHRLLRQRLLDVDSSD